MTPTPARVTLETFMTTQCRIPDRRTRQLRPMQLYPTQLEFVRAYDARDEWGAPRHAELAALWIKKSGKSEQAGASVDHELVHGTESDREIIIVASDLAQSTDLVFSSACRFVRRDPWLAQHVRILRNELVYTETVTDPRTGGQHTEDHIARAVPARDAKSLHGTRATLTVFDEYHAVPYDVVEALAPAPTRLHPRLLYFSYAGLKVDAHEQNPLWDLWQRWKRADDRELFVSYIGGPDGWRQVPWISSGFLEQQRRQFAAVPSKFTRLWENEWAAGDAGSFLTPQEIRDALDEHATAPLAPEPGVTYGLGLDLGLTRDLTGLILSHVGADGRVVVDRAHSWRGTRQKPVDLMDVEATVLRLAQQFHAAVHLDGWNGALLAQRLQRQGVASVRTHTMESSRLDAYATLLKTLFVNRQVVIPRDPELLEQLENLQGEELRRRDQVRFTAVGHAHDDLPCALCLSCEGHLGWRVKDGKLFMRETRIGRRAMPQIRVCRAAELLGVRARELACPLVEPVALQTGCRSCPPIAMALEEQATTLAQTGEYRTLFSITADTVACQFIADWKFARNTEWI